MQDKQCEVTVGDIDHQKAVREPVAALVIAFLLLMIPLVCLVVILRK